MNIVADSGIDFPFPPERLAELDIHVEPHVVTLDGQPFRENVDIQSDEFYRLLAATDSLPTTSQPSVGDLAKLYRPWSASDPDILSIHMTSGLGGTLNAAQAAAKPVPAANSTFVDTKTLSAAAGWQVMVGVAFAPAAAFADIP